MIKRKGTLSRIVGYQKADLYGKGRKEMKKICRDKLVCNCKIERWIAGLRKEICNFGWIEKWHG